MYVCVCVCAHDFISTTYCERSKLSLWIQEIFEDYLWKCIQSCAHVKILIFVYSGGQLVTMEQGRGERTTQLHVWQGSRAELDVERSHGRVQ